MIASSKLFFEVELISTTLAIDIGISIDTTGSHSGREQAIYRRSRVIHGTVWSAAGLRSILMKSCTSSRETALLSPSEFDARLLCLSNIRSSATPTLLQQTNVRLAKLAMAHV